MRSALLFLAIAGCAQRPADALPAKAPGRYAERLTSGGRNRRYVLRVPTAYDGSRRLPLVVLLHGWTGDGETVSQMTGFADKAEREGFVLVAPEGLGRPQGWNVGFLDLTGNRVDDAGFVMNVIDQVESEVGIDPDRVYVAGHSNGAMLAYLVGAKYGDRIAAIAAVSGTIGLPRASGRGDKTIPAPVAPVSAMIIHGTADGMVAYSRNSTSLIVGVGAPECARWWAGFDGCLTAPVHRRLSSSVEEDDYTGGRRGSEVEFLTVRRGTHDWPGSLTPHGRERLSGIVATDLIWDFFRSHPRGARDR